MAYPHQCSPTAHPHQCSPVTAYESSLPVAGAGLDDACRALAAQFQRIVYISCNPETLARDVMALHHTHVLVRSAAFDQFPYSEHLEGGVLLQRRPSLSIE